MPSLPNNTALIERDHALPGLRLLLDDAALARTLRARGLKREYLRYKPQVSCVVGLRVVDAEGDEKWLCVKAYTKSRFEEIKQRTKWQKGDWKVALLKDSCVAFIPPQRDRKLKVLAKLLGPEMGTNTLKQIMGPTFPTPELEVVRYKPNRRLVAKIKDRESGRQAILKIHRPGAFESAEKGAKAARAHGGPKVLAADPETGAVACEWVPGVSLCPTSQPPETELFEAAGERIAWHHRTTFKLTNLPRAEEVQKLKTVAADMNGVLPAHGPQLKTVTRRATAILLSQPTRQGLIHGDFSADQVVNGADGVVIIDWDRASIGDQGSDIGSFLARLDFQELSGAITPQIAAQLKTAFLEGYQRSQVLPASYRAQHICHLVLLLAEPFRAQTADWPELTGKLMNHIETMMTSTQVAITDTALPHLADALSADVMRPPIENATSLTLTRRPSLYRHKPGKRAMIAYTCHTDDGAKRVLLAKMNRKGPDHRAPAMHRTLRAAGLDGTERVGVPQVVDIPNGGGMWFMEHVPGKCLRDLQDKSDSFPFERAGVALGHLHNCKVLPDKVWTQSQELNVLASALGKTATAFPHLHLRLQALLAWAERAMNALPHHQSTCIHRDFYPDQVIVDDRKIWFVDLDLVALGDPAIDVGNFLAHLAEYAMRTHGQVEHVRHLEAAFLNGYQSTGPDICASQIDTLRTVSLMRHISISQLFDDRKHTTEPLLEVCEALTNDRK